MPTYTTGEKHRIQGPSVTGNATFYTAAGGVTLDPHTATVQTVQNAVQALGGDYAGRTVEGNITQAVAGSAGTSGGYVASGGNDPSYTGAYPPTGGSYNGKPAYSNGTRYAYANGSTWNLGSAVGAIPTFYISSTSPTLATGAYNSVGSGTTNGAPTVTQQAGTPGTPATPGAVDITINVPASLGNVADIESNVGDGYTTTTTPPVKAPSGPLLLEVVSESFDGTSLTVTLPSLPSGAVSWELLVTPLKRGQSPQTFAGIAGGASQVVTGLVAPFERSMDSGRYDFTATAKDSGGATIATADTLAVDLAALARPLPPLPGEPDALIFRGFSQDGTMVEIKTGYARGAEQIKVVRSTAGEPDFAFNAGSTGGAVMSVPVTVGKDYTLRAVAVNVAGQTLSSHVLYVKPGART